MKKFFLTLLVFILILVALVFACWFTFNKINKSYAGTAHIFEGATSKQIADILEFEGIVKDADYFYYYIKGKTWYEKYIKKDFQEKDYNFKQGYYKFEGGDFDTVIKLLVKGENDPQEVNITFPEGITIDEIADILDKNKIIKKDIFLEYVHSKENYLQFKKKYPWLPSPKDNMTEFFEGYLHTTTYSLPKKDEYRVDANLIVDKMLEQTNEWYKRYSGDIEKQQYSFSDLITIASVVEKEAKFNNDRAKIAQVFYNRLNSDMKLQSDMTAAYANGEHKVFMYNKDIAVKSPYNTYYVDALPIGPISSPSEASFLAALNPSGETNLLFFYAQPDGTTHYATTLKEHEQNVKKYEHEWKALEKEEIDKDKDKEKAKE